MTRSVTLTALSLGLGLASLAEAQPLLQAHAQTPRSSMPDLMNVDMKGPGLVAGRMEGVVTDEHGAPLAGAAVSAMGPGALFGVTDATGRVVFSAVPVGTYLVRAQRAGFRASPRELVEVESATSARHTVRLARLAPEPSATPDAAPAQPVIAAGFGSSSIAPAPGAATSAEVDDHEHTPRLWRLRHLKRSVLRDTEGLLAFETRDEDVEWIEKRFGTTRAVEASARDASTFLGDASLSGQLQFLTATAFDGEGDGDGLAWDRGPSGVAYATVGAPIGGSGAWSVEGALSRGDLSSWIVAGSFVRPNEAQHALDLGASFALQSFSDHTPAALMSVAERHRSAGTIHAFDTYRVHRRAVITYGARYAWHDYLDRQTLLSPTVSASVSPADKTWLRVAVTQQMLAPGTEEFDARNLTPFSVPPQRTFTPAAANGRLSAERTRHLEVSLEREIAGVILGARRFQQTVDNQLVTLFGVGPQSMQPDLGHYLVANGGNVAARGWVFGLSHRASERFRGSVEYTVARAQWHGTGDRGVIAVLAPSADRTGHEQIHDVTARVATDIRETATRVAATYKVNSAFARRTPLLDEAASDARFDVQVSQRLPFLSAIGADWELVVAVRNLFRDGETVGSIYDELLVVRPPKRVVGGVLVRF